MDISNGASVDSFSIGPSTIIERAIAFRILLCKSMAHLRHQIFRVLLDLFYWCRNFFSPILSWLHPRNPQGILALVTIIAFLLKGYTNVKLRAEMAYRRKFLRNMMTTALTYEEWAHAAKILDKETPKMNESNLYDEELVRNKLRELRQRREDGSLRDIIFCMRADLIRNLGNMCNPELHKGRLQVPKLIKDYIDEVSTQLRMVCDSDSEELSLEEKLAFMHETRHAFGRTLCFLSGGASLGAFHIGVVKTLVEHKLLPRIIAGSSVGSIMCAIVGTRSWPELQSFFEDSWRSLQVYDQLGGIFAVVRRVMRQGAVHEIRYMQRMLRHLTSNLTFQEAYDMTGRVLGITVCSPRKHEPPRCLNYLTSPHVVIWSAVSASCAFPGLFEAQELMAKDRSGELVPYHPPFNVDPEEGSSTTARRWRDGSLEVDLPMMQLKELFNVNHFIVSQANPHIIPWLRLREFARSIGDEFSESNVVSHGPSGAVESFIEIDFVGNAFSHEQNDLTVKYYTLFLMFSIMLAHLTEMEVKHRCSQILELGFRMGGLAKIFAQDWEGDVTVVMPATVSLYLKILQNPTLVELQKASNQGRRCTWEKLSAMKANCGIELALDECVSILNHMRRLKRSADRAASASDSSHGPANTARFTASKRIPSWNCIARENSTGSLEEDLLSESLHHGPPGRNSRAHRRAYDGSDSESEVVNVHSWTRSGGPLMRTTSANLLLDFVQNLDAETNIMVSEADLLHPERLLNGLMLNVAKKEDLPPSSRSPGSENNYFYDIKTV
ncbi:hypothetical protein V6N12_014577 [Hibiscus sabdariffa]|uniref:PNPLA domain-containing protein n=1 Tax=Hibiscus sabdariffa TaxID=183260 RepID=A0ABR2DKL5_9ROSI